MTIEDAIQAAVEKRLEPLVAKLEAVLAQFGGGPSDYLTAKEAAKMAGVTPATVRGWLKAGDLAGHGRGRVLRIRRSELEAFLARPKQIPAVDHHAKALELLRANRR